MNMLSSQNMQWHSHIFNSLAVFCLLKTPVALVSQFRSLEDRTESTAACKLSTCTKTPSKTAVVALVDENSCVKRLSGVSTGVHVSINI